MAGPASGSTTTAATTSAGADDQSTTGDEGNDASATTGEPTDDTSGASTTETTATTTSSSSTTTGDETTAAACEVEIEVCDGVDNDGDGKIDEYSAANTGLCDGCRLRQRLGRVYWICLGSRSWTSARSDCAAKGAYFAAVGSSGENSFLIAESGVDEVENFWLGGSDPVSDGQTGVFFWDNGGAVFWNGSSGAVGGVFHGFGPDEPDIHNDQHCVEIREEDGLIEWNDEYCTDLQGYICEAAQDETCAD
jgi:hypothetical protein